MDDEPIKEITQALERAVEVALKQIEKKNYKQELLNRNINSILEIGIAFHGKDLLVRERK